jgi:hypothetical protein
MENTTERLLKNVVNTGAKRAEYEVLDQASERVPQGKTFTTHFTEHNRDSSTLEPKLDNGRDTILVGDTPVLSGHVGVGNGHVRAWADAGGTFTKGEVQSILGNEPGKAELQNQPASPLEHRNLLKEIESTHSGPNDRGLTPTERATYASSTPDERDSIKEQNRNQAEVDVDALNNYTEPAMELNPTSRSTLFSKSAQPLAFGVGIASGMAANKVLNVVDPDQKIPDFWRTSLSGGIGGALQHYAAKKLTGGPGGLKAMFADTAGGAAGLAADFAVDKGTEYALDKWGASEDVQHHIGEELGDIVGGAAGGLVQGGPEGALIGAGTGALAAGADAIEWGVGAGLKKAGLENTELRDDIAKTAAYTAAGAAAGSFVPVVGTAIGAGLGALAGIGSSLYSHYF